MIRRIFTLATMTVATLLSAPNARADFWIARPIVVHEWGVHEFDWSKATAAEPEDLLPFIHTDKNPGNPQPSPLKRVKDDPPDSGIRKKPILYFYPPTPDLGENIVGVELRFAEGHANAWYPQANIYRSPEMVAGGKEPDWDAWKKSQQGKRYTTTQPRPKVPDDPRMELAWQRLTLTAALPPAMKLENDIPPDHWIRAARDVKSAYVSNGNETEKFLFYEGATREKPAIAVVPDDSWPARPENAFHVVNVSGEPLSNVFAIYRREGHVWIGYAPVLPAMPPIPPGPGSAGTTIATLALPDFAKLTAWSDPASLKSQSADRLIAALTEGSSLTVKYNLRDPADPQGPTQSSQLFADEAAALEIIWHKDFFEADGLTILYRESPAAVDAAMPLNLYTDMYHYIQLSRCGLVLNSNISLKEAREAFYLSINYQGSDAASREKNIALLKRNRFLSEAAIEYHTRLGEDPKRFAELRQLLDQP